MCNLAIDVRFFNKCRRVLIRIHYPHHQPQLAPVMSLHGCNGIETCSVQLEEQMFQIQVEMLEVVEKQRFK
jgi:hypothetical protein